MVRIIETQCSIFANHTAAYIVSIAESIAKFDRRVRPLVTGLPGHMATRAYSHGRSMFLHQLQKERPPQARISAAFAVNAWGLHFATPLFNAAGIFKNGEGYEVSALQGAGAYLAGTTTSRPRMGNVKRGIIHPFRPYPHSHTASNWMGLPNQGHAVVANRLSRVNKQAGCPLGASVSADPDLHGLDALGSLVEGMNVYVQAGVDFLELNESCPNVPSHVRSADTSMLDEDLLQRLEYVSENFLRRRTRPVPVIVKVSNDVNTALIPSLLDALRSFGFDGINIGNTSIEYQRYEKDIDRRERSAYRSFTTTFGGGLSGRVLKTASIHACSVARAHIATWNTSDFHVLRTGGIETFEDVVSMRSHGILLGEWYTGYFERFAADGHTLYERMFSAQTEQRWREVSQSVYDIPSNF